MGTGEEPLERVLAQLDRWRHLPKYRLEQHVDVLFGMTLPTVIAHRFGVDKGELHVVPEFPIKHAKSNQSWNVDFAVFSKDTERSFLVELKTDVNSIDKCQLERMRRVPSLADAVKEVPTIAENSNQKGKYAHLMHELVQASAMTCHPREAKRYTPLDRFRGKPTLVLVAPVKETREQFCCIDFDEYASVIARPSLEEAFARYLRRWRSPPGQWLSDASPSPDS